MKNFVFIKFSNKYCSGSVNETNWSPGDSFDYLRLKFLLHNIAFYFYYVHRDSEFLNFEACGFYRPAIPVFAWRVGGCVEETTKDFI
jgi:hypothetical protein